MVPFVVVVVVAPFRAGGEFVAIRHFFGFEWRLIFLVAIALAVGASESMARSMARPPWWHENC